MYGTCPISPPGGWGSQKPPLGAPIGRGAPIARGTAVYWLTNECAGGSLNDVSGWKNRGILSGPRWTASDIGSALYFNGTTDYITGTTAGLGGTQLTMAARIKKTAFSGVHRLCFFNTQPFQVGFLDAGCFVHTTSSNGVDSILRIFLAVFRPENGCLWS